MKKGLKKAVSDPLKEHIARIKGNIKFMRGDIKRQLALLKALEKKK